MHPQSRVNRVHARRGRPIRGTSFAKSRTTPTLGDFVLNDERLTVEAEVKVPSTWNTKSFQMQSGASAALGRAPSTSSEDNNNPLDLSLNDFPRLSHPSKASSPPMTEMPVDANLMLLQAMQKEVEFLDANSPNRN
ncbi:hypothetical protein QAD02_019782 [Eretmocerus hayati]|uniref:Uncharacterized protein n=1 Tax=Eretmocerus hayati TaxID=131215 RepID=A0ACC2PKP4_9HYME|nr:hypothetical protein QAD02_019782 [Eretmocerus hayati]